MKELAYWYSCKVLEELTTGKVMKKPAITAQKRKRLYQTAWNTPNGPLNFCESRLKSERLKCLTSQAVI